MANSDWRDAPAQSGGTERYGFGAGKQSRIWQSADIPPGLYTALLAGLNNGTGIGVVEVYDRGSGP